MKEGSAAENLNSSSGMNLVVYVILFMIPTFTREANSDKRKWPEERIPVGLEPIPGFNLRAQVVGQGGAYVKHIAQATRCRVQIKGRGSGFTEHSTGKESDEPMFLHVACVLPLQLRHF